MTTIYVTIISVTIATNAEKKQTDKSSVWIICETIPTIKGQQSKMITASDRAHNYVCNIYSQYS